VNTPVLFDYLDKSEMTSKTIGKNLARQTKIYSLGKRLTSQAFQPQVKKQAENRI